MLDKVTRYLSRQYVRRRLAEIVAPGYPILLDYPLKCSHRYGDGKPPHPAKLVLCKTKTSYRVMTSDRL